MPRIKTYAKGARKERKVVNSARAKGYISFRSAGSHSPIDVCIIDMENYKINFIQCKSKNFPKVRKLELMEHYKRLNANYEVEFLVL
jgi:Holliday junction resolvase